MFSSQHSSIEFFESGLLEDSESEGKGTALTNENSTSQKVQNVAQTLAKFLHFCVDRSFPPTKTTQLKINDGKEERFCIGY